MTTEGMEYDRKSLRILALEPARIDWSGLARHAVAFANARGGMIEFGIEDQQGEPPPGQVIPATLPDRLRKGIGHHCINVTMVVELIRYPNGGSTLQLRILPSAHAVAATTDGRYFLRVADESRPLLPEDLPRLVGDKDAYDWESQTTLGVPSEAVDEAKRSALLAALRASDRVSRFVREKSDHEVLEHYGLIRDGLLTHLGVLWLAKQSDRARLPNAPVVQFVKYDQRDQKVAKQVWDDSRLNPMELIEAIWEEIPDWRESTEIPDGLFRSRIPHYDEVVIRELLANALVHRPYTTRGDIFIKLFPDYLEIQNPGLFPLGVTPANILHTSVIRNRRLAQLFYDLKLMEREGSGYDRMYEVLLLQSKPPPIPREEHDAVIVRVERRLIRPDAVNMLAWIDQNYPLRARERIVLGLIAQHGSMNATELRRRLALPDDGRVRDWMGSLLDQGIFLSKGRTKAVAYYINPELTGNTPPSARTSLRHIEPHRLRHLILEDLQLYAPDTRTPTSRADLHRRIGGEINASRLYRTLQKLTAEGLVGTTGKRGRGGGYFLAQISPNKPPPEAFIKTPPTG